MNIPHDQVLIDKLAAEYVLGTLKGGARRSFQRWLRDSMALRRAVAEWEDRLLPMAEFSTHVEPPAGLWQAIVRRTGLEQRDVGVRSLWQTLWNGLDFWRTLGIGSTAVAAILVAVLALRQPEIVATPPAFMAMLSNDQSQPIAMVMGDPKRHTMTVKVLASQSVAADRSLELWAVPKQGNPRSLGLVAANGSITLPMPENATPDSAPVLAVTLEPKGGSPKPDGPTGPVVFKGAWLQV
jgi:anti-sigma-K factor RskA